VKNPVFTPTLRATKHGTTATQYIPYLQRRSISIPLKLHGENRPKTLKNLARNRGTNQLKKGKILPRKKKIRSLFSKENRLRSKLTTRREQTQKGELLSG
jgi:hypothetical protein